MDCLQLLDELSFVGSFEYLSSRARKTSKIALAFVVLRLIHAWLFLWERIHHLLSEGKRRKGRWHPRSFLDRTGAATGHRNFVRAKRWAIQIMNRSFHRTVLEYRERASRQKNEPRLSHFTTWQDVQYALMLHFAILATRFSEILVVLHSHLSSLIEEPPDCNQVDVDSRQSYQPVNHREVFGSFAHSFASLSWRNCQH